VKILTIMFFIIGRVGFVMIFIYNLSPNSTIGEYIYQVINSGFGFILVVISSISTVFLFVFPLLMIEKVRIKSYLSIFYLTPLSVNKSKPDKK
jgi:hypothetical protein